LPHFSRYGGAEQFAWRLAEGLARRGHAVEFLCARKESDAPDGVAVRELGRIGGLGVVKMAWFACRAEAARRAGGYDLAVSLGKTWNQDVLRVGGGPLGNYHRLSLAAWPAGPRRWAKAVSRLLAPANLLTRLIEKRQYGGATRIIAVSHLVREWIVAAHPHLRRDDIPVVYNRPDPAFFRPPAPEERKAARAALGLADGEFAIGTASTNFRLKGVGPLIRALAHLPENARLFVAGGRGSAAYEGLAAACGVRERVRFLGRVAAMPSFYHALDAFSLPTLYDACANATLEALAAGLHVTSSRRNGASYFLPPENVTDSPADPAELAAMLRSFIGRAAPPPFIWPEDVPAGLDAVMDMIERELAGRSGRPASGRSS
jgi:UDP-glucose:(heptosyl)LPS alpha-1,3-glucosyltransferase